MTTDYDQPRRREDEDATVQSLEELQAQRATQRAEARANAIDVDEAELADTLELPGADLSDEELVVHVMPKQNDEHICARCFLVFHRSQLARVEDDGPLCRDCG